MTPDMKYLACTAMLTAAMWVPYIFCQVKTNGFLTPGNYRDPAPRPVPLWGKRADRAYLNGVETFAPFAVLVIIAQLTGTANETTAFCAAAFFWLRVAYVLVYLFAVPYVRTLIFTLGFACVVGIFWQIAR